MDDTIATSIPIIDLKGKEIGELLIRQDAMDILDSTGVDFVVKINSKTKQVVAWLE